MTNDQFVGYPTYGWNPERNLNAICANRYCEPSLPGCICDPTSPDPLVICCCCNQYKNDNNTRQRPCSQRGCATSDYNCIGEKGSRVCFQFIIALIFNINVSCL